MKRTKSHSDRGAKADRPSLQGSTVRARKAKQSKFLEAFRDSGTLAGAARSTGASTSSHYRWLQDDAEYAAQFEEANQQATDDLEQEARRRALDGVEEPVFYKGEKVGSVRKYSDPLLILLLMAKRPEQFRERVDVTSKVDHGLAIDPEIMKTLTEPEIESARRLGRKLAGLAERDKS